MQFPIEMKNKSPRCQKDKVYLFKDMPITKFTYFPGFRSIAEAILDLKQIISILYTVSHHKRHTSFFPFCGCAPWLTEEIQISHWGFWTITYQINIS